VKVSINQLVLWSKAKRETVLRKLESLKHEDGPRGAKLYHVWDAARAILGGMDETDGAMSAAEAARRLTIKRAEEIELNMEVTRKTRIPVETIEGIVRESVGQASGILKSSIGKVLTQEAVSDILAHLRDIPVALRKKSDV
jgi:hypothetical protein